MKTISFFFRIFVFCAIFSQSIALECLRKDVRSFPDGFLLGAATASYQVEGAWDEDGKSESVWDHFTHIYSDRIYDGSNGDVADDSYHNIQRDVEMMRELGLDFYRFSLSWPRILPTGFPDQINEAGVAYYNNLINEMLKYNIQPMVTLFHWDLPQRLQEMGGFSNPHIVDWFGDFARVAYERFGDRVKYWITINEPSSVCTGYEEAIIAPAVNVSGIAIYLCTKYNILSHARAYHIYNNEFKATQQGICGITLHFTGYFPKTDDDIEAAQDYYDFIDNIYAHPIFSEEGDYPESVKRRVAQRSAELGFQRSRLPEFTDEEIKYVRGSTDFIGVNHYTSKLVYRNESVSEMYLVPSQNDDAGVIAYQPAEWESSASDWLKIAPQGFYQVLMRMTNDYKKYPIFVTENGLSTLSGIEDDMRAQYYKIYLEAMLDAIDDGADIRGYTAWSLMDNFEWYRGYTERFGLYEVDYEDEKRTRTPRKSAFVYKNILSTRSLDCRYEPEDITTMTIDEGH